MDKYADVKNRLSLFCVPFYLGAIFQLHTFLSPVIKPEREETLAAMLYMKKTTICKYEKELHDIPSSVLVELAKALHTTPNYLLLGDVEADDWMDDMIQMLEKIKRPEHRELAKKQIALLVQLGDS